ncbi:MAG: hypothetical protein KKG53_14550 [Proteobacteria bacterium]|nr:hypothetical protein [Pseudomonadota bacterium]
MMIADLKQGLEPDPGPLRQRLQAAMVKKLAMMRLQREFHHNDSKINPNSEHMLWAAILLEDDEAVDTLITILITEAHDQYEAQRGAMDARRIPPELPEVVTASIQRLLTIGPGEKLNQLLKHKIKKTSIFKELPQIFR